MALNIKVGDVLRMKKAHPCGNNLWQVGRLGADIGMTCQKCGRHVLLARSYLERRVKDVIPRSAQPSGPDLNPGQEL
ncbi:MAG: hypothetical protein BZY88_10630 [SAR202 cluster bacterium Io17-Chloro-G9]|nr:MAG: hypothetical protein BZY88_10630 [SAR202 cluster bacterium Io17-Chloro-G9]